VLVLTRGKSESIVIDPKRAAVDANGLIHVTIVDVQGNRVRVGVDAPKDDAVHRQEVWNRIHPKRAS
jgi:carbon storage regulator